ncbi:MAG: hypothetical protein MI975_10730 [Cytophagales bacterium]|nr:hypothetical protein [Cytophagales bacterium]
MKLLLILAIFSCLSFDPVRAQDVEHNYSVGPGVVTCDSLKLDGSSTEKPIDQVRSAKFRFKQEFKLTRKQGLQMGQFYSCDHSTGYLIIKYNGKQTLYSDVGKKFWDELITSGDPENFFTGAKDLLKPVD